VDTGFFLTLNDLRVMVALGILTFGFLQYLPGAELDTDVATFASPGDQEDPPAWDNHTVKVQWGTIVYLHDTSSLRLYNKAALTAQAGEQSIRTIIPDIAACC
jgi:hypothetical protein